MSRIVICTLNARYIHTAFGLRYLYANMGELQVETELLEFVTQQRAHDIAEQLLQQQPQIIGFGVYIWNVAEISATIAILKQIAPQTSIILGGPEVSYPPDLPAVAELADFIITGYAETSFPQLCREILAQQPPAEKIISGVMTPLDALASPYPYYSETDLRQRIVYVEASRGCPFKCEFCLSSLDKTAQPFALPTFLQDMERLYQRGARNFKFIDRTFNLKVDTSIAILEFFLAKLSEALHLHFEVIPDHLPDRLKQVIQRFPPGCLQFEVGVQSFDSTVQNRISRRQDNNATKANLQWLRQHSNTHIHADLIFGLPGDTVAGFGHSFDQLIALQPQEIQVGMLKRLRGAPINRHSHTFEMRYDPHPPYAILASRDMSFGELQQMGRFARYWDLVGNSGRFKHSLPLILQDQPFDRFMQFSQALFALSGSTWQIALKRLFELTYQVMTTALLVIPETARQALELDFRYTGEKCLPNFLSSQIQPNKSRSQLHKRQQLAIKT